MVEDFSELVIFSSQDPTESEERELNEAIEVIHAYCKALNIDILINECDLYTFSDVDTLMLGDDIDEAADCIAEYCWKTDSAILLTKDFVYISRYVTDFAN